MARYVERMDELLANGTITQETYDELVDLNAAKEAIREFETVKRERDELAQFKTEVEIAPKRAEAVKNAGVDFESLPAYGQDYLKRNIPADKLEDGDFVASVIQQGGFQAQVHENQEQSAQSGADQIVEFSTSPLGSLAEPLKAGKVTATDFAGWDTAKQREFMKKHPHAYDALTRGQEAVI